MSNTTEFNGINFIASSGRGRLSRLGDNAIPVRLDLLRLAAGSLGASATPADLTAYAMDLEAYVVGEVSQTPPRARIIGAVK